MLVYELLVRGIAVDASKTVDELRSALRPLLKVEKSGGFTFPPYTLKFGEEKTQIRSYIEEAKEAIRTIPGDNAQAKFVSTQSRLVHLVNRINRIPLSTLSNEEQTEKAELLVDVLSALSSLEEACKQDPELSRQFQDPEEQVPPRSSPRFEATREHEASQLPILQAVASKPVSVEKWNLKFTGDIKKKTVHNFLERVEELRSARNMSIRQLFDSAIDLFSGKALNWFRSNRDRFHDWFSLADLLRRHFEPPDYRARLFKEILERTQDTTESIVDYLTCMQALFRRYGGMSEGMQLDTVRRNLSPFYATQLPEVDTLEELEEECLKLEAKKYRVENYVPPSRKRQQFVEPDFAFVAVEDSRSSSETPRVDRVDEVNEVAHATRPPRVVNCWNCQEPGHLNRNCPNPKRIHCFRCGASNVTVRSCPKCSNSGNDSRVNR